LVVGTVAKVLDDFRFERELDGAHVQSDRRRTGSRAAISCTPTTTDWSMRSP